MGMIAEPNKLDHDAKGIVLTCAALVQEEVPRKNGVKAPPRTMVQIQHAQQTPKFCSLRLKANPINPVPTENQKLRTSRKYKP